MKLKKTKVCQLTKMNLIVGMVLGMSLFLVLFNAYHLQQIQLIKEKRVPVQGGEIRKNLTNRRAPVVWIHGARLQHVKSVCERLGFVVRTGNEDWDVFWTYDYPFYKNHQHFPHMQHLKSSQRVNHFPGILAIIKKARLATTIKLDAIPKAFLIPKDRDKLLAYAKKNPSSQWIQKKTTHRGIKISKIEDLDFKSSDSFVQEFVANPYLIDGRMFDFSVYIIVTSLNPLRMYMVNDDTPLRFCNKEYYPFNASDVAKYVVPSHYTPIWKIPSFKDLFVDQKFSFQESFNRHLLNKGFKPEKIWSDVSDILRTVFLKKQHEVVSACNAYGTPKNFFELVRADFMIDENMKVYLLEVNMSPNLASDVNENEAMYLKVILNTLRLTGVASMVEYDSRNRGSKTKNTNAPDREVFVFSEWCTSSQCKQCGNMKCSMCRQCMQPKQLEEYREAYIEHINNGDCKRLFPPEMNQTDALGWDPDNDRLGLSVYSDTDRNMYIWFIGMCRKNIAFCK